MFAVIKNILSSENINWGILLSTSFFLLLGIIYFIRRYTNLELNQRQNVRNAAENSDFQHLQIEIHVQINLQRKTFVITPNEIIGAFINSKINSYSTKPSLVRILLTGRVCFVIIMKYMCFLALGKTPSALLYYSLCHIVGHFHSLFFNAVKFGYILGVFSGNP